MERFEFDEKEPFLEKLEELVKGGVPKKNIDTLTPYHVHEAEEILDASQSSVRYFALGGGISGLIAGFAFTIYTVKAWPMITGGKPLVSTPAFLIIAYELTILFGALCSFFGFILLSRLPATKSVLAPKEEFTNKFEIHVKGAGKS
jgi:hypothetical protein